MLAVFIPFLFLNARVPLDPQEMELLGSLVSSDALCMASLCIPRFAKQPRPPEDPGDDGLNCKKETARRISPLSEGQICRGPAVGTWHCQVPWRNAWRVYLGG
jgi:hypothetical protein